MSALRTFCLLFITHIVAPCQMLTESGSIVTLSGDTLRGEISIRRTDHNPRYLEFVQGGTTTRYRPHEIASFHLDDNTHYIGVATSVDKSPSRLKDFDEPTRIRGTVTDTVFLFLVISGDLSLFKLVDENGKAHFYIQGTDSLTELRRIVRRQNLNGQVKLETTNEYKNQLRSFVRTCPRAEALIDQTSFYQKDLSKVVVEYNRCQPGDGGVKQQKELKAQVIIAAIGGLSIPKSAFRLNGNFGPYLATFSSESSFTGGGMIEIVSQKRLQGVAVANEFVIYGFNFIGDIPQGAPYYLDYQYFRYNLGGRYYLFRSKPLHPFVQAGAGIGYAYQRSYNLGPTNFPLSNEDYGLHVAVGAKYNRFGLQGRLDRSIGPSEAIRFTTRVNNWQVLVTIDLIRSGS